MENYTDTKCTWLTIMFKTIQKSCVLLVSMLKTEEMESKYTKILEIAVKSARVWSNFSIFQISIFDLKLLYMREALLLRVSKSEDT